jgi:hypothetical protein
MGTTPIYKLPYVESSEAISTYPTTGKANARRDTQVDFRLPNSRERVMLVHPVLADGSGSDDLRKRDPQHRELDDVRRL